LKTDAAQRITGIERMQKAIREKLRLQRVVLSGWSWLRREKACWTRHNGAGMPAQRHHLRKIGSVASRAVSRWPAANAEREPEGESNLRTQTGSHWLADAKRPLLEPEARGGPPTTE